jgi:hypothetical protein
MSKEIKFRMQTIYNYTVMYLTHIHTLKKHTGPQSVLNSHTWGPRGRIKIIWKYEIHL